MAAIPVERGAQVRFPPPLVFLGFVLLGVATHHLLRPAPAPMPTALRIISGLIVLVGGAAVGGFARMHFVRTGQSPVPWKPSPELILEGPYRFTRNPMYLGMTLFEAGLGLAVNNLWITLFALPALLTVHLTAVLPEERYLTGKFGESYRSYLARVRRYL
jgi:protein-S-isoprenylcysteine O-methyltransferase Ste14